VLRDAVANDHVADLNVLDEALGDRCNALTDDPDTIRGHTLFHWWPAFFHWWPAFFHWWPAFA
jgi:hypothetical protein